MSDYQLVQPIAKYLTQALTHTELQIHLKRTHFIPLLFAPDDSPGDFMVYVHCPNGLLVCSGEREACTVVCVIVILSYRLILTHSFAQSVAHLNI